MRGVDTNVLVRLVTGDDPEQSRAARELVEGAEARRERLHIAPIVLCELVWVLRGKGYGHSWDEVAEVLERLLQTEVFVVGERDLVQQAAAATRTGRGDFSDHLIGLENRRAGCADTVTFDRDLEHQAGFAVLPSR